MTRISRRALMAMSAGWAVASGVDASAMSSALVEPFPLDQVRLRPSIFLTAVEANGRYLRALDADRLLHNFRQGARLAPKGPVYGGWEAQGIAGHSLGHYLSALSLMYAQTGEADYRDRARYVVRQLRAVQQAQGDGYAGGTTVERGGKTVDGKVVYEEIRAGKIDTAGGLNGGWVPIYTYHKVLAGALDAHALCDDPKALAVAIGLGDYLGKMFEPLDTEQVQAVLRIEHGGIVESFAELHARTGQPRWLDLARRVQHTDIIDPLVAGRDDLAGKHANTQIPKLIGEARLYETGGDARAAKAAMVFWETVVHDHSYVIGGNSEFEHFGKPRQLSARLGQQTCECCNSYNMLKLTRHLHAWSGEARYFDFYERAHLNHILSQQDPETGMFTYFSPLASGYARGHSTPTDSFWCCVGTGMENYAKRRQHLLAARRADDRQPLLRLAAHGARRRADHEHGLPQKRPGGDHGRQAAARTGPARARLVRGAETDRQRPAFRAARGRLSGALGPEGQGRGGADAADDHADRGHGGRQSAGGLPVGAAGAGRRPGAAGPALGGSGSRRGR
jgi:DUF1680 family protein